MKKIIYVNESSVATKVRNFLRFATGAADPEVFYFSLNGMVMPLSRKA